MRSLRILIAIACASAAASLGGCATFEPPAIDPAAPTDIRVTLPPFPSDIGRCLTRPSVRVPDRDLTVAETADVIASAKLRDKQKIRCGRRAVTWAEALRRDFAKP